MEKHIRSCTVFCSYCKKQVRKDQLSDHYEVCYIYWKMCVKRLQADKKYWTDRYDELAKKNTNRVLSSERQQITDHQILYRELNKVQRNLSAEKLRCMQKQRYIDELRKKNEYHENREQKINPSLKFHTVLYILCFSIGFLFSFFMQRSSDDSALPLLNFLLDLRHFLIDFGKCFFIPFIFVILLIMYFP